MPSLEDKKCLFLQAHSAYHSGNGEHSPLSDDQYDVLKRELIFAVPAWPPLSQAGWRPNPLSPLQKGKHIGFLGSIYNAFDYAGTAYKSASEAEKWEIGMEKWMEAHEMPVVGTLKVDGLSVAIEYKDGIMMNALTRGDCIEGESVTHHIAAMPFVPLTIVNNSHIIVRGEVVMFNEQWREFKTLNPEYVAARNAAAGIMGRKDIKHTRYLRFVAHDFQFINPMTVICDTFATMLECFKVLDFIVPSHQVCSNFKEALAHFKYVERQREGGFLPYEIDGVVFRINDNNSYTEKGVNSGRCPRGAVAWKFPAQTAVTKLLGVDLSVGHTGAIAPTAVLQPVKVGDVTVSRASLANFDQIERLGIGINDQVEVSRQGDVIPAVVRMIKGGGLERIAITRPSQCPVCQGQVGHKKKVGGDAGAVLFCLNPECPAQSTGKIKKWISSTGIMDVGDSVVEAMVEAKLVDDPADLYLLTTAELQDMPFGKSTYGVKRAGKVVKNIGEKRQLPLNVFLGALGVTGLGEGVARNVREKMPGRFDKLTDWVGCTQIIDFAEQISLPNTARAIYDGLEAKRWLVHKLLSVGVGIVDPVAATPAAGPAGPLSTCVFCFTGSFSQQKSVYKAVVLQAGGGWEDDVRGNVTHVVMDIVPSDAALTGKAKKAKAKGIPVIDIEQFNLMLRSQATPAPVMEEADDSYGG